jgi:hypothetical protein
MRESSQRSASLESYAVLLPDVDSAGPDVLVALCSGVLELGRATSRVNCGSPRHAFTRLLVCLNKRSVMLVN